MTYTFNKQKIRLVAIAIYMFYGISYPCMTYAEAGAKSMFADDASSVMMSEDMKPTSTAKYSSNKKESHTTNVDEVSGLQYSIELQDSYGSLSQVTTSHVFQSGDGIKLKIKSKTDGYLYVVNRDDTGQTRPLFPLNGQNSYIAAGTTRLIPDRGAIRFDNVAGQEIVTIALSKYPVNGSSASTSRSNPGTLVSYNDCAQDASAGSKGMFADESGSGVDMSCLRSNHSAGGAGSKGMFTEEDSSSAQPASYAVVPSTDLEQGQLLFVDFNLTHR